ncbi:MAG: cytochrome c biogenesis protein CcdA, partial [Firmicutes bacterium]|nr:cytochrome c biogenesis protein CcdA [Bacillota bacterium]
SALIVLGAGMAAAFNPCGVAMLPSYVAYLAGQEAGSGTALGRQALRGIAVGLWMTLGFVSVFVILGLLVALAGRLLFAVLPWLSVLIGLLLVVVGGLLLAGRQLEINTSRFVGRINGHKAAGSGRAMYLYGVVYAVASLGCTLPVFLLLVAQSLVVGRPLEAIVNFLLFAAGMGLVVSAISAVSLTGGVWLRGTLRWLTPWITRASAVLVIGAGLYLVVYWVITRHLIGSS